MEVWLSDWQRRLREEGRRQGLELSSDSRRRENVYKYLWLVLVLSLHWIHTFYSTNTHMYWIVCFTSILVVSLCEKRNSRAHTPYLCLTVIVQLYDAR